MATEGPNYPVSGAHRTFAGSVGDDDWNNLSNIEADDTSASITAGVLLNTPENSYEFHARGFGFTTVGDTDTITDIQVILGDMGTSHTNRFQKVNKCQLATGGVSSTTDIGDNKAGSPTSGSDTGIDLSPLITATYAGTVSGYWNVAGGLTGADVKDAYFGVVFQREYESGTATYARIDYVTMMITYTEGGGGPSYTLLSTSRNLQGGMQVHSGYQ